MKKLVVSILAVVLFITACSNSETLSGFTIDNAVGVVVANDGFDMILLDEYGNVSNFDLQLLLGSDLVVIGEFVEDCYSRHSYFYSPSHGREIVRDALSFNQLQIIDVLQGEAQVGDVITVAQYYYVDDEGTFVSFDGLTPMRKGDRWIYFLSNLSETAESIEFLGQFNDVEPTDYLDTYFVTGYRNARFPVPSTERPMRSSEPATFGMFNREDFPSGLHNEILNHFQIEAQDWLNPGQELDVRLIDIYRN
jgi:hypothetical protein